MVTCPKCGMAATPDLIVCPGCGAVFAKVASANTRDAQLHRLRAKTAREQNQKIFSSEALKIVALAIAALSLVAAGLYMRKYQLPPPVGGVQKIEAVYNSPWDGSVRQAEKYLKQTLKDPNSLQIVDWGAVSKTGSGYLVSVRYRAKNSFGGYVVTDAVFRFDASGNVIDVAER